MFNCEILDDMAPLRRISSVAATASTQSASAASLESAALVSTIILAPLAQVIISSVSPE